ncbi:MAG: glycosyltransferase [Chitinivibrionia bacterium]|nr:glycosyltransferase [Chitinivibrionia bacterium]
MKVLIVTHMYPSRDHPENGIFVEQQVASLGRCGIDMDVLHVDVKKSKWLYPWSFVPLQRRTLARRYDLVHAHYVFAGVVARSQFRFPVVLTHHGDEALHGWQAPLCRMMSRLADKTIVVTEAIRRSIGVESAAVIPCGVDFEIFKPMDKGAARERLGLDPGRKLVLFVGDYPKQLKRFDIVARSVELLKSRGVDAELVVAYKQVYERVPLYMNACDVLVLASERGGSPQVIKESMACNLPVVSVDVGDVADVLAGVRGCHLSPRDPESIADRLSLVLERCERTDGREKSRRYELNAIAKRIIEVYEETAGSRRRV